MWYFCCFHWKQSLCPLFLMYKVGECSISHCCQCGRSLKWQWGALASFPLQYQKLQDLEQFLQLLWASGSLSINIRAWIKWIVRPQSNSNYTCGKMLKVRPLTKLCMPWRKDWLPCLFCLLSYPQHLQDAWPMEDVQWMNDWMNEWKKFLQQGRRPTFARNCSQGSVGFMGPSSITELKLKFSNCKKCLSTQIVK